jgi:hypothetical protein
MQERNYNICFVQQITKIIIFGILKVMLLKILDIILNNAILKI